MASPFSPDQASGTGAGFPQGERTDRGRPLFVIEPNLRSPSGHYAEFVRALGSRAADAGIEVFAHPAADDMLSAMPGVRVCTRAPRVGQPLAEWRTIARAVREDVTFLVLTSDGRHAAAVSLAAKSAGRPPEHARFFVHRPLTEVRDALFLSLAGAARMHSLAVAPTETIADSLRTSGWRRVACVPYPALGADQPPEPVPFTHLLMAGAARRNKGLDLVAALAVRWAAEGRSIPLFVHVSKKHATRHGHREATMVRELLSSGYRGLRADETAPDRAGYLARFRGALVLAPYAREQFASQVSGIVLDALLHGTPVITTRGTWPGAQCERFGAGVTIAERTPAALASAIDRVLSEWPAYAARACAAARVLAQEHDPRHLLERIA
jgi:glycosyltransferase involved in cell wall biosynthesis